MSFRFSKSFLSAVFLLFVFTISFSQERTLDTWKTFMPYGVSLGVFDAGDKIYSAASKTVFSYEINSGTIQIYDKANGLSDIGIKTANYDPVSKVFAIAYDNSNLDLIYNGTDIYNIPDIKNKNTSSAVSVNCISFYNGNAYVSTDMGISVIDLSRKEISNTYIIGSTGGPVKVYACSIDGTNIYAATEEGVKHAPLSSSNLQDFNNWILYDAAQNLPKKKATFVTAYNSKVYAVIDANNSDTLFEFNGSIWTKRYDSSSHIFTSLNVLSDNLYFSNWSTANISGKNGKIDAAGNITTSNAQHARPIGWFMSNGVVWEADYWNGLFKNVQGNMESILPDGPFSSSVYGIAAKDGVISIAPGGVDDSWGNVFNRDGFFIYKNNSWTNKNQYNSVALTDYPDLLCVTTVPDKGKSYFGSFWAGLVQYDYINNSITTFDKNNSILEGAVGDSARTRISAVTSDKYGNVWISNAGATKPIKVLTTEGAWKEFSVPYFNILMKKMIIDQNDQLWAPIRSASNGLLVWSYNGTLDDLSDDKVRLLSIGSGNGGLPDARVFSLAEDRDGNIWVGTSQGIGVYYCPGSVLTTSGCDADQIKVERDGYIGYLFGTESVRAIAVDAANRKWIGTTNGLWLISDDGKKELLKFTTENSPLPSNQITDISIDDKTGEVFIGTLGGLVSYQGDAMAECSDCDAALVYPNPVKPDYNGPIAIKGLTDNAYVKITDVAGTLVYQGKANGSQMIWNGKGYSGNRVKSGVYLVFSSTDLGKERRVGKILVAN